jgi:hypothetical protein
MHPRLGIVIPYRDRRENLDIFLPHIANFFANDPLNNSIPVRILLVEQTPEGQFNRGAIKNIGFAYLAPDVDYICFHDVDLVPTFADYRRPEHPVMIAFHGLDFTPDFVKQIFGGVVLLQKEHFKNANGHSNSYWGWGYEDVDFRERLLRCGLKPQHREGHFTKLPHVDEGNISGSPTEAHLKNRKLYTDQWFQQVESRWYRQSNPSKRWRQDGLISLRFNEVMPRIRLTSHQNAKKFVVETVMVSLSPLCQQGVE